MLWLGDTVYTREVDWSTRSGFLHRYTQRPLHLFGTVGLLFTLMGVAILAGFAIDWAITRDLHVRPLMLGGVAFMIVGIQFVSIGLLGEMINNRLSDRRDAPVARAVGAAEAGPGEDIPAKPLRR